MIARMQTIAFLTAVGVLGCSDRQGERPTSSRAAAPAPAQPAISLTIKGQADLKAVREGAPLDVVCTVRASTGAFEPGLVIFQIADSTNKRKQFESRTVGERKSADNGFAFEYHTKAPAQPGRFAIDAKVVGADPTIPASGPALAPRADGGAVAQGARAEFNAPTLEIEVVK